MKRMLLFLFLIPMAFAAWQNIAALAMSISFIILAVIYAVGFGFGISQLQIMAKEELFQLIALGVLMVALVGTDGILNTISTSPAFAQGYATMQEAARGIIDETLVDMQELLDDVSRYDKKIAIEASRASQCNIMGMGYSVSGCGGFSMLATPLSMSGGILGFAMGELSAMERLIEISETFALTLLLPVGIVLRTLKLTRGAGGLLIALGVSLHIMLPAGIIFNEMLGATFLADIEASEEYQPEETSVSIPKCNPADTGTSFFGLEMIPGLDYVFEAGDIVWGDSNEEKAMKTYADLRRSIRSSLYTTLIRATLGPVISLLMVVASIRALTSIAGAEVDVSAISRFV